VRPFSAVRHRPRRDKSLAAPGRGDAVTPPWPCLREVGLRARRLGALAPRLRVLPLRSCLAARRVHGLVRGRLPPPVQLLFRGIGRGHPSGSISRQTAPSKRFYAPPTFSCVSEQSRAPCPAPAVPRPVSRPFRVPGEEPFGDVPSPVVGTVGDWLTAASLRPSWQAQGSPCISQRPGYGPRLDSSRAPYPFGRSSPPSFLRGGNPQGHDTRGRKG